MLQDYINNLKQEVNYLKNAAEQLKALNAELQKDEDERSDK